MGVLLSFIFWSWFYGLSWYFEGLVEISGRCMINRWMCLFVQLGSLKLNPIGLLYQVDYQQIVYVQR